MLDCKNNFVPSPRNSNIELFRILVMLLIVAHHYVVNSGLMPIVTADFPSAKSTFLTLFGCAGKIGINCFVLITGYFMCQSQITLRKALKLLFQIELYKIVFCCIFVAMGYIDLSPKAIFKNLAPIVALQRGFVDCYIVFFGFIPFINILINGMSKKQHQMLLGLSLLVFSIFPQTVISLGYSYVSWFMVVYLIAAYFRLYPPQWSLSTRYTGLATMVCVVVSLISVRGGTNV